MDSSSTPLFLEWDAALDGSVVSYPGDEEMLPPGHVAAVMGGDANMQVGLRRLFRNTVRSHA
jgi:hypothetical protein